MDNAEIKASLKQAIIDGLDLEECTPEDIADDEPLFGDEGMGLDSLDAVELVVVVDKNFGVRIGDMTEGRKAFASINALADYIREHRAE